MSHESHERRAVSGVKVARTTRTEHDFKQTRRGRPGPDTAYRRITHRRYDLEWNIDSAAVTYDEKSDGTYPLITNDRKLTPLEVLDAHKGQQTLEKRFEQLKTVHAIAPVILKNPARIEAFFTIYFFALLVQALIERELRRAMQRASEGATALSGAATLQAADNRADAAPLQSRRAPRADSLRPHPPALRDRLNPTAAPSP